MFHLHSLAPYVHPAQYDRAGQVTGVRQVQVSAAPPAGAGVWQNYAR